MTVVVLAGFALATAAPLLYRLAGRWTGCVLAAYPAVAFVAVSSRWVSAHEGLSWAPALGVELAFAVDGLTRLFALLITGIGVLVVVYAGSYLQDHRHLGRFYAYLLGFMASMLGLVAADNVMALFIFWELTSVSSFLLIGFEQERPAARAAALQALYVTASGGLALLAGLLLLGYAGGSLALSSLAGAGGAVKAHDFYVPALLLIVLGAATKSAQVPFHFWLPNAMEAPTPVSAYLHSSTMVKAGVYLLARLQPALGGTLWWTSVVGGLGAVTAVAGAWLAWRQTDLKRILACSTVSALGQMTLLIGLGTGPALHAVALLILVHALYKGALFLAAGTVAHEAGERDIRALRGLGRAMPATAAAAALGGLSMAGVPPFGGFLAKEAALDAALGSPGGWVPAAAALAGGGVLVGAVGLLVGFRPFVGPAPNAADVREGSPALWAGAVLLAAAGLWVGLNPASFAAPLVDAAARAIGAPPAPMAPAVWHGFSPAFLLGMGVLGGAVLLSVRWRAPVRGGQTAAERGYALTLLALLHVAGWQTRVLQSGYLRRYLLVTTLAAGALGAATLAVFDFRLPAPIVPVRLPVHEGALLLMVVVSAVVAAWSGSRLAAVAALGIVGYGVALVFVTYGAPDLAMTQFVIETLTVILFLFAFRGLPSGTFAARRAWRRRDAVTAGAAGALMTVLVLATTAAVHEPSVSAYFLERSVPDAHGRNVVNVILVDFRALDTLGEISVLAVAGIGVYALLRLRLTGEARP